MEVTSARQRYSQATLPALSALHQNVVLAGEAEDASALGVRPSLPLFGSLAACGTPAPADEHVAEALDLHAHVVRHPDTTFFVRAYGDSMIGAGIYDGDLCVVDRSIDAHEGHVVVAEVGGEVTMKTLRRHGPRLVLAPENDAYPVIHLHGQTEAVRFLGVVTFNLHELRSPRSSRR